jgi:ERCC4-type nuclease
MKFHNIFSRKKASEKPQPKITIDHREKNSLVVSELKKLGFQIEFKLLPVADYLINSIAIERKTLSDFKSSIINKRLPQQLLELKQYPQHFLILEGLDTEDPYSGSLHENAFRGFLLSTITEFQTPLIFTLNEKDTAKYLYVLAKKPSKQEHTIRVSKIYLTTKEQLQFILEGFPNIGPVAAKKLLKKFKTLNTLFSSSLEDLQEILGKKAENFFKLLHKKY